MNNIKMLGISGVAAVAIMAFAGGASAATFTSPTGTAVLGNGSVIEATSKHTQLDGIVATTCTSSSFKAKISDAHLIKAQVTDLKFAGCGPDTVEPLKNADGSFGLLHFNGVGNVYSSATRITILTHRVIFVPITTHCIYGTGVGTPIGMLVDSHDTATNATLTFGTVYGGMPFPEDPPTDTSCADEAVWTGDYTVTSPNPLYID